MIKDRTSSEIYLRLRIRSVVGPSAVLSNGTNIGNGRNMSKMITCRDFFFLVLTRTALGEIRLNSMENLKFKSDPFGKV